MMGIIHGLCQIPFHVCLKPTTIQGELWGRNIHDLNGMEMGNDVGVDFLQEISYAMRVDNHWRA